MAWLLFVLYLVFFCWLITRLGFVKRAGLSKTIVVSLFVIKIIAGIVYFQFHSLPEYKNRSDTWKFYDSSLAETKLLKGDPVGFFTDIFITNYGSTGNLFSDDHSYWNDVKDTIMVKLMAVANLFTLDHYYSNLIFFGFIFFIGLVAFYRLMKSLYPDKKLGLVAAVFLIPSFLFWCSGIHKDGLIFSAIGFILFSFHSLLNGRRPALSLAVILVSLMVVFFLRNYLVFALVPCLFAGWLMHRYPQRRWLVLSVVLAIGTFVFFAAPYVHPDLDLPSYLVDKRMQFKSLEGRSVVVQRDLQPGFLSFITNLPAAIDMAFFRPHPSEPGLMSVLASIEVFVFWMIVILCIVYRRKEYKSPPVIWIGFLFAVLVLLIIGYTVPFSGAVVRYRSLVMPLLLAPLVGNLSTGNHILKKYI